MLFRALLFVLASTIAAVLIAQPFKLGASAETKTALGAGLKADVEAEVAIRESLNSSRPDITVENVRPSLINGVYEVQLQFGPVLYVSGDGKYFVQGDLFEIGAGGFRNLAEAQRESNRASQLAALDQKDMIIFPAESETKGIIYVFTDVDCGYCQKLHNEVPELNKAGIEVRYLAYPRAGLGSKTSNQMISAWCAQDKKEALTKLKARRSIPSKVCPESPVAMQYALGQSMGVTGTPYLITEDGQAIAGYVPHARLAMILTDQP